MSEGPETETWAVVELMGHGVVAGRLVPSALGLIRVEVPAVKDRPAYTQEYGQGAIYRITYCDAAAALRALGDMYRPPVPLSLQLPAPPDDGRYFDEDSYVAEYGDDTACVRCCAAADGSLARASRTHVLEEEPDLSETDADEPPDRAVAAQWARDLLKAGFVILDVETTGLDGGAEIVQLGVLDHAGDVILDTLVKPTRPIPPDATAIHGITDAMVADAPAFAQVYGDVYNALDGESVVAYNASFDFSALRLECDRIGRAYIEPHRTEDAMVEYARFWGEWDERKDAYRWVKLTDACVQQGIDTRDATLGAPAHSAIGDCRLVLALVQKMAGDRATAVP